MKSVVSILALSLVVLSGCSKPSPEEYTSKATVAINERNFNVAIEEYEKLIADHPQSPQAEEALYMIARLQNDELKNYPKAIETYKRYLDMYPQGKYAPVAVFLSAYLYHNELNDLPHAKEMYERFLASYPDHEMAPSAKFELDNLGKKPEELLPVGQEPQVAATNTPSKKSAKK
ncbi:MAG TPA: tetratricopeptide repeat protein [Bacteroidota bacterium]|nr:tetratricopeptide repeat protein [Bacteroidota bacterium]